MAPVRGKLLENGPSVLERQAVVSRSCFTRDGERRAALLNGHWAIFRSQPWLALPIVLGAAPSFTLRSILGFHSS